MEETKNNYKAWLYLAPVLILLAVFTFFPIINTFVISFLDDYNYVTGSNSGFTFDNYGTVLGITEKIPGEPASRMTDFIRYALPNTLIITFITVPISVIIALVISLLLNRVKFLHHFFQTIFFLPYVTNVIAVGMVFAIIFDKTGIFNHILGLGEVNWVEPGADYAKSMFVLCLYVIWTALPFKILIFSSGLQNIDQQYYDAAKVDGASKFKTDLKVVLPLLSPQILYISITSFISGFKEYSAVVGLFNRSFTSDGNTHNLYTVVYYIYDQLKGTNGTPHLEYAAAGCVVLFAIILVFTIIQLQISKKRVYY